jgi:hypothetical protein
MDMPPFDEQEKLRELNDLVAAEERSRARGERPPAISAEFVRDMLALTIERKQAAADRDAKLAELTTALKRLEGRVTALEGGVRFQAAGGATAELRVHEDGAVGLRVHDDSGRLVYDFTST